MSAVTSDSEPLLVSNGSLLSAVELKGRESPIRFRLLALAVGLFLGVNFLSGEWTQA